MGFAALVGGLIGARLDFIIENYSDVKDDLLGNLFSGSGLVWYGGAIGGAIGVFLWAWWRGFLTLALLDLAAPALAIGYAIGRCGCQLSGDGDYGKAWNGPWAMAYPDGTKPTDHDRPSRRRSTRRWRWGSSPSCSGGCATASPTALLFALYLLLAGTERFLVEFIRRNDDVALGLTQAQLISVGDDDRRRRLARCSPSGAAPRPAPAEPRALDRAQQAAVERDHRSREIGGPLRAEERDQVAVLLRLAESPRRDSAACARLLRLLQRALRGPPAGPWRTSRSRPC